MPRRLPLLHQIRAASRLGLDWLFLSALLIWTGVSILAAAEAGPAIEPAPWASPETPTQSTATP